MYPPEVLARRNGGSGTNTSSNTSQSTQSTNTSSNTNSNSNNSSNSTTKKKDEYDDDNRYNYNHTWDYKTNSFVDSNESSNKNNSSSSSSFNNSNKNSSSNNNSNSSNNSSNSSSSKNDEMYWELDGKIYYSREEWLAAYEEVSDEATKKHQEEEQENIKNYAKETLKLVNEARAEEGHKSLTLDPDLVAVAEIRAKEISEYYSHTRPDGRQYGSAIDDYGCDYFFAGENIAKGGAITFEIKTWLNSSGHRATLMMDEYQYYGAAAYWDEHGSTFFVQVFGGLANP